MTRFPLRPAALALMLFHCTVAHSYDWATHALFTQKAFERSYFGSSGAVYAALGLGDGSSSLGHSYLDIDGSGNASLRFPITQFEDTILDGAGFTTSRATRTSLSWWILRGVIREDDITFDANYPDENTPQDEPGGNFNRVFAHFWDPQHGKPLTTAKALGPSAVDWLLDPAAKVPFFLGVTREGSNHYGVAQAREAMWRALTLTTKNSDGTLGALLPTTPLAVTTITSADGILGAEFNSELLRNAYWATTFRSLGDMVHLLEDMAQPQHTRNDSHSGRRCAFDVCPAGHGGFYESYMEARAKGKTSFTVGEGWSKKTTFSRNPVPTPGLVFDTPAGYPTVRLASYREYLDAGVGTQGGYGLSDYSSLNFYSAGTVIGSLAGGSFISPSPTGQGLSAVTKDDEVEMDGVTPLGAPIQYLQGPVVDYLVPSGTEMNVSLSSYGAFDQFLRSAGSASYVLTYRNYDEQARLLGPRAVAYTAGLIDYFFRGKLAISRPDDGPYGIVDHAVQSGNDPISGGFRKIKLKVQNLTTVDPSNANSTPERMAEDNSGMFVVVARFHRNLCYQADLSGEYGAPGRDWHTCRNTYEEIVTSNPTGSKQGVNDGPTELVFNFDNPIPISATDLYLQVVYRGPLGNEPDAIVTNIKDITEPSYVINYVTWDQYTYSGSNFSIDPGPMPWTDWCSVNHYPSLGDCNSAMGMTIKGKYSPNLDPVPNFDPATVPPSNAPDTWHDIDPMTLIPEPCIKPVITMTSDVGRLTRVALLLDVAPNFLGLRVEELLDRTYGNGKYQWATGYPIGAINQVDPTTNSLVPAVNYIRGRGQYLPEDENLRVNSHSDYLTDDQVPALVLAPSIIKFEDTTQTCPSQ